MRLLNNIFKLVMEKPLAIFAQRASFLLFRSRVMEISAVS